MQTLNATELGAHAATVLMGRWCVEEPTAVRALEAAATELDVRLADLAALVVAASLVPSDWASRRGALVKAVARPGDDQPSNAGTDDPDDPPPDNPSGMKDGPRWVGAAAVDAT